LIGEPEALEKKGIDSDQEAGAGHGEGGDLGSED
jgi:hypothetical protein